MKGSKLTKVAKPNIFGSFWSSTWASTAPYY